MMPKKDGFQVVEDLRRESLTAHIPIILLTGKADAMNRLEGLKRGADVYLSKPYDLEELKVQMDNLLLARDRMHAHVLANTAGGSREDSRPEPIEDEFLLRLVELLEQEGSDADFGIKGICERMHISLTQLDNKTKAITGLSTSRFVRHWRLQKATGLLKDSALTISEIAYEVGFHQPSYFSNSFKGQYGCSPMEFRQSRNLE